MHISEADATVRRHWSLRPNALGALLVAVLLCSTPGGNSYAQALSPQAAASFIQDTANRMVAVVDANVEPAAKARQLQALVDSAVDVTGIAQFCLGRYWQSASVAQRQEFLGAFASVLLDGVTGQIRNYKGVQINVGRPTARDAGVVVASTVLRPQREAAQADWLVVGTPNGLKIEDLVAEGTSLRLTRRNDYGAFLSSHGGNVDTLLAAMRQRSAQP